VRSPGEYTTAEVAVFGVPRSTVYLNAAPERSISTSSFDARKRREERAMRPVLQRVALLVVGGLLAASLVAGCGSSAHGHGVPRPVRARVTKRAIPASAGKGAVLGRGAALPSKRQQERVLDAAYKRMVDHYPKTLDTPGPRDVVDYGIGKLWSQGIDGAGRTIAVIEGWDDPSIAKGVAGFDKGLGLPNPRITRLFPSGDHKLPAKCPPAMVKLGDASCQVWEGELVLDVYSAHLMAPYANIVISATPADSEITEDAASQVAPPEMMQAVEAISRHHLANVISISDGTGEASYSHGRNEVTAQNPGELTAAGAGIPVVASTGDCGAAMATPAGQCEKTPGTQAWDDSSWTLAV
jgi:hypothetical protein